MHAAGVTAEKVRMWGSMLGEKWGIRSVIDLLPHLKIRCVLLLRSYFLLLLKYLVSNLFAAASLLFDHQINLGLTSNWKFPYLSNWSNNIPLCIIMYNILFRFNYWNAACGPLFAALVRRLWIKRVRRYSWQRINIFYRRGRGPGLGWKGCPINQGKETISTWTKN